MCRVAAVIIRIARITSECAERTRPCCVWNIYTPRSVTIGLPNGHFVGGQGLKYYIIDCLRPRASCNPSPRQVKVIRTLRSSPRVNRKWVCLLCVKSYPDVYDAIRTIGGGARNKDRPSSEVPGGGSLGEIRPLCIERVNRCSLYFVSYYTWREGFEENGVASFTHTHTHTHM